MQVNIEFPEISPSANETP